MQRGDNNIDLVCSFFLYIFYLLFPDFLEPGIEFLIVPLQVIIEQRCRSDIKLLMIFPPVQMAVIEVLCTAWVLKKGPGVISILLEPDF